MNEARYLRLIQAEAADALDRLVEAPPEGTASFLGVVYDGGDLSTSADRVVLMHPVEMDGDDGEGDTPTFTADETRSIPVVAIGSPAPKAGDRLEAYAVGGRWVAEVGCGSSSGPPDSCASCPTSHFSGLRNLTLSWSNGSIGPGSTPLAWVGPGCIWETGCDSAVWARLDLTATTPSLRLRTFAVGDCPNGTPIGDCSWPPDGWNCSPYIASWTVTNTNCHALYGLGFRGFTTSL